MSCSKRYGYDYVPKDIISVAFKLRSYSAMLTLFKLRYNIKRYLFKPESSSKIPSYAYISRYAYVPSSYAIISKGTLSILSQVTLTFHMQLRLRSKIQLRLRSKICLRSKTYGYVPSYTYIPSHPYAPSSYAIISINQSFQSRVKLCLRSKKQSYDNIPRLPATLTFQDILTFQKIRLRSKLQ